MGRNILLYRYHQGLCFSCLSSTLFSRKLLTFGGRVNVEHNEWGLGWIKFTAPFTDKRRWTPSSFYWLRGKHELVSRSLYFFPMGKSHSLNGRAGKHSTEKINPEALFLLRVCSKLLHNTLFPRLVNKFAIASWRFITKWLYPWAN